MGVGYLDTGIGERANDIADAQSLSNTASKHKENGHRTGDIIRGSIPLIRRLARSSQKHVQRHAIAIGKSLARKKARDEPMQ